MPTSPATTAFDGLTYNSRRPHISIPEYGRVVHEMVAHCIGIEDREERNQCAAAIVSVMRTLVRERSARSIIDKPEFVLELTSQGGLILVDELTGYWIAIEAFGPDNYREFRSIFDKARESSLVMADRN